MTDPLQDKTALKSLTLTDVLLSFVAAEILSADSGLELALVFADLMLPPLPVEVLGDDSISGNSDSILRVPPDISTS